MARAIVPVVLKLISETDGSVDAVVQNLRSTLEAAARTSLGSISGATSKVVSDVTTRAQSVFNETKINFITERSVSQAKTGILGIEAQGKQLDASLSKISDRFYGIAKASSDLKAALAFDKVIDSATKLYDKNDQILRAIKAQKFAAEELAKAPKTEIVDAKAVLDKSTLITKTLVKEAQIIKNAYNDAFNEVAVSLTRLEKEAAKTKREAAKPARDTSATTNQLEIDLINARGRATQIQLDTETRIKKNTEERFNLERKISDVVAIQQRARLQTGLENLSKLSGSSDTARQLAAAAQLQLQRDIQKQLEASRAQAPSTQIQVLRQTVAQSKILAESLERDARKAESAYTFAFKRISLEAEKALKQPTQGSRGSLGGGLGIFSPLANQIGGIVDSIVGSIGGQAAAFRSTAGIQIGQALSQGIGKGIEEGANFIDLGGDRLLAEFSKLDGPAKALIANIGTGIVVGSAAAAAAMGGLAFATTKVASDFEVLTAKLTTTFKNPQVAVERFQLALELAAKTPYNVEQVVAAQVQLSALGQRNIETLRRTIDLSSGLNADLARTSNEVGKAAAGSYRGYQELRNTLGITTERLKEFGAVTDKNNRLLLQNEFQIERNREALFKLIDTDFGGSAERLSQTLQGRISNLQDEILKLSGAIGSAFLPSAKSTVSSLTSFVELLNDLPQSFKIAAAGAIGTAAAVALMTTSLAAASVALGVFGGALSALSGPAFARFLAVIPGARLAVLGLNAALNTVAVESIPLLGTSLATAAPILAGLVAVAGLVNTVLVNQQQEAEAAGELIKQYSQEIANARRANIAFKEDLVRVFDLPKDFITDADTAEQKIAKLQKVFQERGALKLVQDMDLAGISAEELNEQLIKQQGALDKQGSKLSDLRKLRDALSLAIQDNNRLAGESNLDKAVNINTVKSVIQDFEKLNPALATVTNSILLMSGSSDDALKKLDQFIKIGEIAAERLQGPVAAFKGMAEAIGLVNSVLDKVQKPLARLEAPTKFALKVGDINLVNDALAKQQAIFKTINDQIVNTKGLREKGASGAFTIEEASRLSSGAVGANKLLIDSFIKTNETITELEDKRVKLSEEHNKFRLQLTEANEKEQLNLVERSDKQRQLQIIRSAIQSEQAKADAYKKELTAYLARQDQLQVLGTSYADAEKRFNLQNAQDRSAERIKAGKAAFDFVIDQKNKEKRLLEQIDTDAYKDLKTRLGNFVSDTKQIVQGVRPEITDILPKVDNLPAIDYPLAQFWKKQADAPLTAAEKVDYLKKKLVELSTLESSTNFDKLGSKGDEAREAFRDNRRTLEKELSRARLQVPKENLADFNAAVDFVLSEAIGKEQQLFTLRAAQNQLNRDYNQGLITTNDYRDQESKLQKKIVAAQLDINKVVSDQAKELEKIRNARINDEIEILKLRRENASEAEKVLIDSQVKGRKRQAVQGEVAQIKAERDAEIAEAEKNGKDKNLILQKYAEKELELVRKSYLEFAKAEDDKYKAVEQRLQKEQDKLNSFRENRVGGINSPLISVEELAFRSSLSGFGSDLDSRLDRDRGFKSDFGFGGQRRNQLPSFESFKTKFEQENKTGELGKGSQQLPGAFDGLQAINTGSGTQITAYVSIDGRTSSDADIVKGASDLAMKAIASVTKDSNILSSATTSNKIQAKPFGAKSFGAKDFGSSPGFGFEL